MKIFYNNIEIEQNKKWNSIEHSNNKLVFVQM